MKATDGWTKPSRFVTELLTCLSATEVLLFSTAMCTVRVRSVRGATAGDTFLKLNAGNRRQETKTLLAACQRITMPGKTTGASTMMMTWPLNITTGREETIVHRPAVGQWPPWR